MRGTRVARATGATEPTGADHGYETYHEPSNSFRRTRRICTARLSLSAGPTGGLVQQRAEACSDEDLRAFSSTPQREIEHAMMVLEWIRHTSTFDGNIATYLKSSDPSCNRKQASRWRRTWACRRGLQHRRSSLGIGSLRVGRDEPSQTGASPSCRSVGQIDNEARRVLKLHSPRESSSTFRDPMAGS